MEPSVRLPSHLRERANAVILHRIDALASACAERDQIMQDLWRQLEGTADPAGDELWPGACQLNDPLTREHHISLLASLMQTWGAPPWWMVEAEDAPAREAASAIEAWVNNRAEVWNFRTALYDAGYTALALPYAVMYVGWKQDLSIRRVVRWQAVETGEVVETEEQQNPDLTYEPLTDVSERVVRQCAEYRVPDSADFYLWPPDAQDVDQATAVIERMRLTREDLLDGIESRGYDRDSVLRMIAHGPNLATSESAWADRNDADGITSDSDDGYYEVYQVIGRMPLLMTADGELDTPEEYLGEDWVWVAAPDYQTVLKFAPSPYPMRPYVVFGVLPRPGRLQGDCVTSLLIELQEEATHNLRFTINSMNITASPALTASPRWINRNGNRYALYPGAVIEAEPNDNVRPLTWDMRGAQAGLELQSFIDGRTQRLISAQGASSLLAGKVRKNAEVEMVGEQVGQKLDLFLSNLQVGMDRVARLMVAYAILYMEGDQETVQQGSKQLTVTRANLESRFRFKPRSTSADASPNARLQRTLALIQFVRSSPIYQQRIQIGDMAPEYALMRRGLEAMGEHNPEELIGTEEELQQRMQMAQAMMSAGAAGGAAPGSPEEAGVQAAQQALGARNGNSNGNGTAPSGQRAHL